MGVGKHPRLKSREFHSAPRVSLPQVRYYPVTHCTVLSQHWPITRLRKLCAIAHSENQQVLTQRRIYIFRVVQFILSDQPFVQDASMTVARGPMAGTRAERGKTLPDPAGANRLLYLSNSSRMLDRTGPYCPSETVCEHEISNLCRALHHSGSVRTLGTGIRSGKFRQHHISEQKWLFIIFRGRGV